MTADDTRRQLAEIPELMALLPDAAGTKSAGIQTSRPVPGSRPPVNLDILHLADSREKGHWTDWGTLVDPDRQGVLPFLDGWCRDLEATGIDGDVVFGIAPHETAPVPEEPTVTSVCSWLLDHLDWAATLPQWPELADGIRVTWGRLRQATRHVRDKEDKPVPCERCGGPLDRLDGEMARWACGDCGHLVTVQAVTLRQAAGIVGMPARTLQDWARRPGVLSPVLGDSGKRKLFDLGDIRRLVAERRLRGTG